MERKDIQAVFLDWNGTLSTHKFWWHLQNQKHPKYAYFDAAQSTLFGGPLAEMLNPWMLGEHNSEDVIHAISNATSLPYEDLLEEFIFSCKTMELVSPEVLDLVEQIRDQSIKVVIATDNMDSFGRWTVPSLGLDKHFDAILNSSVLHATKREGNKFFGTWLTEQKILPSQTIIIDDSEDRDGILAGMGIQYRKINFGEGLVPELKKILIEVG